MRRVFISIVVCQALACASFASAQDIVSIHTGRIQGSTQAGVTSFKGVPFAAPPVGKLRWMPPQPAAKWSGVRQSTQFGHDCMQVPSIFSNSPAEDCLYINVWTPEHHGRNLPVMVWIYGGAWVVGGSSLSFFDGSQLARKGVVFVSFNYRLGRFGYFAFPALTKESKNGLLGNYGYMDQVAALKWVQRNIASFGGDPHRVTIFGQSAGGFAVHMLMTSPLAKGLFQGAIAQSGGGGFMHDSTGLSQGMNGRPSAEQIGVAFARSKGIDGVGKSALKKLRALPAEAILDGLTAENMMAADATYAGPMYDGKLLVGNPPALYEEGEYQHVPMIVGATNGDASISRATNKEELFAPFGADAKAVEKAYDAAASKNFTLLRDEVGRDELFVGPARFVAQTLSSQGDPVWEYRFSYVPTLARSKVPAALHGGETPFVFDGKKWFIVPLTPADEQMAQKMSTYWVNFAKTGNPNGAALPDWPSYHSSTDMLMNFSESGPIAEADPWQQQLNLIEKLEAQQLKAANKK
ncbi:MAG: carboxylesterase/lipase family protein [Acidobacteriaceae bacterium]